MSDKQDINVGFLCSGSQFQGLEITAAKPCVQPTHPKHDPLRPSHPSAHSSLPVSPKPVKKFEDDYVSGSQRLAAYYEKTLRSTSEAIATGHTPSKPIGISTASSV